MWPWEHLALGYLLYSGYARVRHRGPPPENATVVLAVTTQFPDLVDKPLAWTFGVLPSGTSLAHSVVTAVPIVVLALLLARRFDRQAYGEAVGVGYGSHLLGDLLYPLLTEGVASPGMLFWPVSSQGQAGPVGMASETRSLFGEFVGVLSTTGGHWYLAFEGCLLAATVLLWLRDGRPGTRTLLAAPASHRRSE